MWAAVVLPPAAMAGRYRPSHATPYQHAAAGFYATSAVAASSTPRRTRAKYYSILRRVHGQRHVYRP